MKQILILLSCCLLASGCSKDKICKKGDDHHYFTGIELRSNIDTFTQSPDFKKYGFHIQAEALHNIIKPDEQKCDGNTTLEYKFTVTEGFHCSDISIYCNKPLIINKNTISAKANLLEQKSIYSSGFEDVMDQCWGGSLYMSVDTNIPKGSYTFYASGTTNLGNYFIDSVTIIH